MSTLSPAIGNTTGNAQTSEVATVSISTGANPSTDRGLIVPFVADLYVDASGTVGTLQEVAVTMTGIDQIFNVTLSAADSVKILNSFEIADTDNGAEAGVSVGMKNEANFEAGLIAALDGTTVSTSAGGASLYDYLKAESRKDTVDILSYDSLANLLEASDLLTYDIAIDASGGASNMYAAMDGGSAAYRQAIFKQIPQANVESYITPSNGTIKNLEDLGGLAFLPLKKGDKMTFVFDVAVGEYAWANVMPSSGAKINSVINDAATAGWTEAALGSANLPAGGVVGANAAVSTYSGEKLVFTTPSKRRVAITVQFSSGGGAFSLSDATLAATTVLTA